MMKTNETNVRRGRTAWGAVILVACLLPAAPLAAQEARPDGARQQERIEHLHWILEGLERGMESLAALDRHDAREHLEEVAHGVRRELEQAESARPRRREAPRGGDGQRRIVEAQADVLRLAMRALLEAERHDAAHLVEKAIHARELMLEGRRDREAQEIRESAPKRGEVIELLVLAEGLYREFDRDDTADRISRMTEELWQERGERDRRRAVERERRERERIARADRNEQHRERERAERAERARRVEQRPNDHLRDRLDELQEHLANLQREMEALHRELERRDSGR